MPLLTLADALLSNASKFLGCYEDRKINSEGISVGTNRSKCIDEIQKAVVSAKKDDAYCAKFVSKILNITFPFFLKLPPAINTASTITMRDKAAKLGIIRSYPVRGSVFFRKRTGGGHVGFVESIVKDENGKIIGFNSIEGNAGKTINGKRVDGIVQLYHKDDGQYLFMDFPSMADIRIPTAKTVLDVALITAGIIGATYTYRRFGKDAKVFIKSKTKKLKSK
jgi:hypothetical protein